MRFWPKICFGLLKSCAVWLNYSGNWSQQSLQTVFFAPPPTSTMVTRWCKFPPSATLKIALLGLPKRRENVSPENKGAMSCLIRTEQQRCIVTLEEDGENLFGKREVGGG